MKRAGAAEASFDKTTWIAIVILKGQGQVWRIWIL